MLTRALLLATLSLPAWGQAQAPIQAPTQIQAQTLDPGAIAFRLPDQIPWGPVTANGNQQAVLVGDPSRHGFYAVITM